MRQRSWAGANGCSAGSPGTAPPHDGPGEPRGQLELEVGGDPELPGQLQRKPPPDGPVRHDDSFGGQRIPRLGAHEPRERRGEGLQPIGLEDAQAAAHPSSFATPFGTCPMAATPRAASQWRRWSSKKMSAPKARRNSRFSLPPRKRASSIRIPHARRVRTTRS